MNNTNQPKQPSEPRQHVFSPHTDRCIYCGKSAQDDAVENTECGSGLPPLSTPERAGLLCKRAHRVDQL
jgi:hypothetical protein